MTEPDGAIDATAAARAELAALRERHGSLMLVQSGGCCDGSSPLCLTRGELLVGPGDLLLGEVDGTPFYIDADQYERWNRPSFVLDLCGGSTDAFSLEAADGVHFVTRSDACAVRSDDAAAEARARLESSFDALLDEVDEANATVDEAAG